MGKILLACEGVNQDWLLTGKGEASQSINTSGKENQDMLRQELIIAYKKLIERDEKIFELEALLRKKPSALVGITTKKLKA